MASLEIGECSNNTQEGSCSSSIIKVGYQLTMNEEGGPNLSSALIFRVPEPLRNSNDHFYSPHLVSIGPFHYGRQELSGMEKHKSEAVRRMQKRIQNRDPNVTIESIVEVDIVEKDEKIREFYGENISYSAIELAWMVTRDACFIFEFIINYIRCTKGKECEDVYEEMRVSTCKYDPIFDVCFQNPTRNRVMDDILQFENQIPLFILQHLFQIQMGSLDAANVKLDVIMKMLILSTTRQNPFMWAVTYPFHKSCHVLEVLYHSMVGKDLNLYKNEARKLLSPSYKRVPVCFKNGVHWIKVNFNTIFARWCKLCPNWLTSDPGDDDVDVEFEKLPSAVELNNAGVKLQPVLFRYSTEIPGIAVMVCIRFDEKTSTLYLPEVCLNTQAESLWRSVITMEVSSDEWYNPRPMTQFSKLMDELVDSEEDVAVLTKGGIIKNHLGSNQEAAQVFNSLTKEILYSTVCKPIDDVRLGLHKYTKRKYKILWNEFRSAYFSKPWLVAGSIAAMLLLQMTVVQVFCLFYKCSR